MGLKVGLEKGDSTILLHGTLGYVICSVWNHLKIPVTHEVIQEFSEGRKVPCPVCQANALAASARQSRERKVGVLRPAIVLYEELIPDGEIIIERSVSDAKARPTLLIVMGTSLSVKEIRKLVGDFRKAVKKENGLVLFVNLKTVEASLMAQFDHWISADADSFSEFVMEILQVRPSPVESLGETLCFFFLFLVFPLSSLSSPSLFFSLPDFFFPWQSYQRLSCQINRITTTQRSNWSSSARR